MNKIPIKFSHSRTHFSIVTNSNLCTIFRFIRFMFPMEFHFKVINNSAFSFSKCNAQISFELINKKLLQKKFHKYVNKLRRNILDILDFSIFVVVIPSKFLQKELQEFHFFGKPTSPLDNFSDSFYLGGKKNRQVNSFIL